MTEKCPLLSKWWPRYASPHVHIMLTSSLCDNHRNPMLDGTLVLELVNLLCASFVWVQSMYCPTHPTPSYSPPTHLTPCYAPPTHLTPCCGPLGCSKLHSWVQRLQQWTPWFHLQDGTGVDHRWHMGTAQPRTGVLTKGARLKPLSSEQAHTTPTGQTCTTPPHPPCPPCDLIEERTQTPLHSATATAITPGRH